MAACVFSEVKKDVWHCPNCDLWMYTDGLPVRALCEGTPTHSHTKRKDPREPRDVTARPLPAGAPPEVPCMYRGEIVRIQKCKPCENAGKTGLEVFSCSIHGECSERNSGVFPRVRACSTCTSYAVPVVPVTLIEGE